jgi:squalene-hopene/tetraprenyl-beta-curcumene cyclase
MSLPMSPGLQIEDAITAEAFKAEQRAVHSLLRQQDEEGYWWSDLTADTTLESDYFLLLLWLYPPKNGVWTPPNREVVDRCTQSILSRQLPDGGFNIYPGGPSEISASVKAYTALKLAGLSVDDERMRSLRERVLVLGGMQAANSYTKINLSLFGLYPRQHTPRVPVEMMLLRNAIYEMSSWSRAIVIPLSILHALDPLRPAPDGFTVDELLVPGVSLGFKPADFFTRKNLFYVLDRSFKYWERHGIQAIRNLAIRKAEQWILDRKANSDGLAAIYPPMMYTIMALDLLGYAPDHPARQWAEREFERLLTDNDARGTYFQPCFSVVWDSAIAGFALGESGLAPEKNMQRAADWLLTKEVRQKGDWAVKRPDLEPSGWYFEFANEFYPDIDDTAMVLLCLSNMKASDAGAQKAAQDRAVNWLIGMQGKDGGWAAFDVDNNWEFLSDVPFADHNAMLDPSCPDITGRVMEGLARMGVAPDHPAMQRGMKYLEKTQEQDGSWYGRWGVNYVYGTFLALRGLRAAGVDDREAIVLRAGEWLRSVQNADGGWGESCASYDEHRFVAAPSTPSQTAWAVIGLLAGGDSTSQSVQNGVEYLIRSQRSDGGWDEDLATGTGFPGVFYLSYHNYRNSFPLLALAAWRKTRAAAQ